MLAVFEENGSAYQSVVLLQNTSTVPVGSHNGGETTGTRVFDRLTGIVLTLHALIFLEGILDAARVFEVTVLCCMEFYEFLLPGILSR